MLVTSMLHHVNQMDVHQSIIITSSLPTLNEVQTEWVQTRYFFLFSHYVPPLTGLFDFLFLSMFCFIAVFLSPVPFSLFSYSLLGVSGWLQPVRTEWLITVEDRGGCSPYQCHLWYIPSNQQHLSLLLFFLSFFPLFLLSLLFSGLFETATDHLSLFYILFCLCTWVQ